MRIGPTLHSLLMSIAGGTACEIGYAFPAPTGIVDYELRNPGDGTPSATVITKPAHTRTEESASTARCHSQAGSFSCRLGRALKSARRLRKDTIRGIHRRWRAWAQRRNGHRTTG